MIHLITACAGMAYPGDNGVSCMPSSLVSWFPQHSDSKDIAASVVAKSSPTVLRNENELRSGADEVREADDDSRKDLEAPGNANGETPKHRDLMSKKKYDIAKTAETEAKKLDQKCEAPREERGADTRQRLHKVGSTA